MLGAPGAPSPASALPLPRLGPPALPDQVALPILKGGKERIQEEKGLAQSSKDTRPKP